MFDVFDFKNAVRSAWASEWDHGNVDALDEIMGPTYAPENADSGVPASLAGLHQGYWKFAGPCRIYAPRSRRSSLMAATSPSSGRRAERFGTLYAACRLPVSKSRHVAQF